MDGRVPYIILRKYPRKYSIIDQLRASESMHGMSMLHPVALSRIPCMSADVSVTETTAVTFEV